MARAVQAPGEQAEIAVVLRGGRGVGKTFAVEQFGTLFKPRFLSISNAKHFVGNFNQHLESTILLLADEAFYQARWQSSAKALIFAKRAIICISSCAATIGGSSLPVSTSADSS
jgi:hypothetical protein